MMSYGKKCKPNINSAYVEITKACNNRCIYCYNNEHNINKMTLIKFDDVLDKLAGKDVRHIILGGGEPTVHPELSDMFGKLNSRQLSGGLSTNGVLITDRLIEKMNDIKAFVQVSLDTTNAGNYEKIRGSKKINTVLKNITRLVENDIEVSVGIVLLETNRRDHEATITDLLDMGVNSIHVSDVKKSGLGDAAYEAIRVKDYYENLIQLYNLYKKNYQKISVDLIEDLLKGCIGLTKNTNYCNAMQGNSIHIDTDGNAYRCVNIREKTASGNIFNDNRTTWHTKKEFELNETLCGNCEYVAICRGGCRALTNSVFGNLNERNPRCLEIKAFIKYLKNEIALPENSKMLFHLELQHEYSLMNGYQKWV